MSKDIAVEQFAGEYDRNADMIKFSRAVVKTGVIPVLGGQSVDRNTLAMLQSGERKRHARQVELSKAGVKPSKLKEL
jgi:hypothetical protein